MEYKAILDFWFPNDSYQEFWFDKSVDEYIKTNFSELLYNAEQGYLDHWCHDEDTILALIILLDQFSRNIYRDNKKQIKNINFLLYCISFCLYHMV